MNLLIALTLLSAFAFYVYFLWRSVYFGWLCLLTVELYEYSFGISQVNAGSIHLDVVDVVSLGLLISGVMRTLPRLAEKNTARMIALGYLAIFTISLIRGAISNTFITAANESRGFTPILISILYFLTAPVDTASLRKYIRAYLFFGLGYVVVAMLAYAGLHIGGAAWLHSSETAANTIEDRLLPAACALSLAVSFVYSLAWEEQSRYRKIFQWLPAVYLGTTVFLRHRSVWNALLFGLLCYVITDNRVLRRLVPMAVLSLLVVTAFAGVATLTTQPESDSSGASTEEGISESVTDQGSLKWRIDVWTSVLLGQDQTFTTVVLGKGLGEGYITLNPSAGRWINAPPHSEYLTEYSRVGVLGVLFILWYLLRPLVRLWSLSRFARTAVAPSVSAWLTLIVAAIVYGITYTIPIDTYALVGIACAAVASWDATRNQSVPHRELSAQAA
jgi:O-antigen ligase